MLAASAMSPSWLNRLVNARIRAEVAMARYCIDAETLLHIVRSTATPHASHQLLALVDPLRRAHPAACRRRGRADRRRRGEGPAHAHDGAADPGLGDRVSRWTAWQIAREQGWSDLHDAEHFAVTRLQADAFVTVDPPRAQRAEGIVPTAEVNAPCSRAPASPTVDQTDEERDEGAGQQRELQHRADPRQRCRPRTVVGMVGAPEQGEVLDESRSTPATAPRSRPGGRGGVEEPGGPPAGRSRG
ncbi:MAG: hypothetical protein IPM00_15865 [Tetrasphaera sp.]|nr:hypothetical protein [Tetrasphaera sp.]